MTMYEIDGQLPTGVWHPLFQYHSPMYARAILTILLEEDRPGQGCDEYVDFRLREPSDTPPPRPPTAHHSPKSAPSRPQKPRGSSRGRGRRS